MKFLPGARHRKASSVNKVILMGLNMNEPIGHPPYDTLARESYERNIVVYQCVNEIAKAVSSVPWCLMRNTSKSRNPKFADRLMTEQTARKSFMYHGAKRHLVLKKLDQTEVEDHPLLSLLEKPNPTQGQADYFRQKTSYWLLAGNSYEEPVALEGKGKQPRELWNLRPGRIKILPSSVPELGLIGGYEYRIGERKRVFKPEEILHQKFFHPTDDFYGMSPLMAAARAYYTDNLAADWNYALLKNQARPSGALLAPTTVTDDTFDRIKQEIEENFAGDTGAGRPLFLEGGLKWEQLGLSPLEMDWLAGAQDNRRMICAVYNTPPELIGDPAHKTYNSFPEARRAFWMEAVLPLLDAMRDAYNNQLVSLFGDGLFLDYDRDQIDALAEESATVWKRMETSDFVSVNEKRDAVGMEPYDGDPQTDPEADVPVIFIKQPNTVADPNAEPAVKETVQRDANNLITSKTTELLVKAKPVRERAAIARLRRAMKQLFREQGVALDSTIKREMER